MTAPPGRAPTGRPRRRLPPAAAPARSAACARCATCARCCSPRSARCSRCPTCSAWTAAARSPSSSRSGRGSCWPALGLRGAAGAGAVAGAVGRRARWPRSRSGRSPCCWSAAALVLPRVIADPVPTTGTPAHRAGVQRLRGRRRPGRAGRADRRAAARTWSRSPRPASRYLRDARPAGRAAGLPGASVLDRQRGRGERHRAGVRAARRRVAPDRRPRPRRSRTSRSPAARWASCGSSPSTRAAPVRRWMPRWRADLALLRPVVRRAAPRPSSPATSTPPSTTPPLRAGMAGCDGRRRPARRRARPTWSPTERTQLFGPQIDHVIATDGHRRRRRSPCTTSPAATTAPSLTTAAAPTDVGWSSPARDGARSPRARARASSGSRRSSLGVPAHVDHGRCGMLGRSRGSASRWSAATVLWSSRR